MHFHAEHSLFFERRQPLWRAALSMGLTLCVLIANVGAGSTALSVVGAGCAFLLLLHAHIRGHRRLEPALTWTLVLVVSAVLGSIALSGDADRFTQVAARVLCGVLWVLWLGTEVDWSSIRQIMLKVKVPSEIVHDLDRAFMHGLFTTQEWTRRRDAARLRLGRLRLPLSSWGQLLGEGALRAFMRLEQVEQNSALRGQLSTSVSTEQGVTLDAVCVERGGHEVLKDLDLRVDAGEWLLLCGASGAGKSSLLRLLAGLDAPSRGAMTRLGTSVTADTALRDRIDGRIALLNQNPEEHFIASTVEEDIMWGLLQRGVSADVARQRCAETAAALGVEHLLKRPCHALSFGEQRRVALAGVLVLEPTLLLLDEPTAGLDPVAAHELRALVSQTVQQTGAACVWATHDLHSVPPQAKRIILLRNGRTIFDGAASEGLSQPWLVKAGLASPHSGQSAC